jgi:hypothetical protein
VSDSAKTRDLAYDFVKQNWDALIANLPTDSGASLPFIAERYCDEEQHRQDAKNFFEALSTKYTGGPRNLDAGRHRPLRGIQKDPGAQRHRIPSKVRQGASSSIRKPRSGLKFGSGSGLEAVETV